MMTDIPTASAVAPEPADRLLTTTQERAEFRRLLSGGRMSSYDDAVASAAVVGADEMEYYAYNMALAAAYLGPLHILEVVTRNAIHAKLSSYTRQDDWWDSLRLTLVKKQQDALTAAENKVDEQLRVSGRASPRTPDDVVAALDFGFWTGVLGRGDAKGGAHYERDIWQPAAQHAFPNYRGDRGVLWKRFDNARKFRNRITHHEPVHTVNVRARTGEILRLISFVSMPVSEWVTRRSRLGHLSIHVPTSATPVRVF